MITTSHNLSSGPNLPLRRATRPRGYATVLAMLFLAIAVTLATAFYSGLMNTMAISKNTRAIEQAQAAQDSGLEYWRYKLTTLSKGMNLHGIVGIPWMTPLYNKICLYSQPTVNFPDNSIQLIGGYLIKTPAVTLKDGSSFLAEISPSKVSENGLTLQVTGQSIPDGKGMYVTRTAAIELNSQPFASVSALNFAIISKGGITINSSKVQIDGYDPSTGDIDGRIGKIVDLDDTPKTDVGAAAIVLLTAEEAKNPPTKESFGDIDYPSSDYAFLSTVRANCTPYKNITSADPVSTITLTNNYLTGNQEVVFDKPVTINGVLYVEWGTSVKFTKNVTLNGAIVFQRSNDTSKTSKLTFDKAASVYNYADSTTSKLPSPDVNNEKAGLTNNLGGALTAAQIDELRKWSIIAPDTAFDIENGNDTATRHFEGSLNIGSMTVQGAGTADNSLVLSNASIVCEGNVTMEGNRVLWVNPPVGDGGLGDTAGKFQLFVVQSTYRETY